MIITRSMNRSRRVHVVNARLPVYKLTYGNGLGDVVTGLAAEGSYRTTFFA